MNREIDFTKLFYTGEETDLARTLSSKQHYKRGKVIHFVNAYSIVSFLGDANQSSGVFSDSATWVGDGIGGVAFARIAANIKLQRFPGPDFMETFFRYSQGLGLRQAIIGGSESDLQAIQVVIKERFSQTVDLCISPPFGSRESWPVEEYVRALSGNSIDVCWVALGTPLQDNFAHELNDLRPSLYVCIGAGLNFLGGTKPRSPAWMSKAGLEWLYRLSTEPKRLWKRYTLGTFQFIQITFRYLVRRI